MKILIVEDEASSRHLLKSLLSGYGACELAEDGPVAVEMFKAALSSGQHYDLVTLDIKLPTMDGMEVLRNIRRIESDHGIQIGDGTKVIMTTALSDHKKVIEAFNEQCEVYLVKPIEKAKLVEHMRKLKLID